MTATTQTTRRRQDRCECCGRELSRFETVAMHTPTWTLLCVGCAARPDWRPKGLPS